MQSPRPLRSILLATALAFASACGGTEAETEEESAITFDVSKLRPDLVPVATRSSFCGTAPLDPVVLVTFSGYLIPFTVKNQGLTDAPGSEFEIRQRRPHEVNAARGTLSPIPAGQSVTTPIFLFQDCFQPDCEFKIVLDPLAKIAELDDRNNVAFGGCPGPFLADLLR